MSKRLFELPAALNEPIGTTGAVIQVSHVGLDADGLPRARMTIRRGDLPLATDVVRLDRVSDRRALIRAALKEEAGLAAELFPGNGTAKSNGDGQGSTGDGPEGAPDAGGANSDGTALACTLATEPIPVPLTDAEIERTLRRVAKAVQDVGPPPAGDRDRMSRRPYLVPFPTPPQAPEGTAGQTPDQAPEPDSEAPATEAKSGRREVLIKYDLARFTDDAEQLLLAAPGGGIYKRARMLVRVVREGVPKVEGITRREGAPVIEAISVAHIRDLLARHADWYEQTEKGIREALPPKWLAETILARGDWPFPRLAGVIETPALRSDGTVLNEPGYDPATGFLYEPSADFPQVPENPTQDEVLAAIRDILEPFSEFPFAAESDRASALAAVLTLIARTAIDGPTPLFALRANVPGAGKTLMSTVIALIGTGREPTLFAVSREDEEVRKRLLTIGLEGVRCVSLDNAEGSIGSPSLAAALTSHHITDRILGTNRLATVPLDAVWLTTGNNLAFKGDLGRRVVPIDIYSRTEFPEDRKFKRENLCGWVRQERPRLVGATLTLLRAFHVAGCPGHSSSPMGSFESWDALVRAAVVWLGFEDPCAGRSRVRNESDTDLEALGAVLESWFEAFGSEPRTLAGAIESAFGAAGNQELATALASLDSRSDGRQPRTKAVGDRLRLWKGRIVGGLVLETTGRKEHGSMLWRVARVGE